MHAAQLKKKNQKWVEDLNRYFFKENLQMSRRHMKKFSASLIIKEFQITTTVTYHLTSIKMAISSENLQTVNAGGVVRKGTLLHC